MAAVATKPVDRELRKAQEQIVRWRKGGPALFAVEALGMPPKYDPLTKRGVVDWWWEASEKLVRKRRLSVRSGHGVGKSAFQSISILWFASCYFPCKIPCTAPTAHQYGAESNVYKVRVQGEFASEADDVVIPLDLCETAKIREVEAYGDVVWGVDVARFGRDRTTLVKRRQNATIAKHLAWQGQDLMQTAGRICAEWLDTKPEDRPKSIFVDVIGIGAGLADRLMELGLPVVPVNVAEEASVDEKYLRLRDELWFKARKWLERKDCKLFDDEVLIAELTLPRYGFTSTGKLKVESKDELKKRYPQSPDVADAFCLTFSQTAEHRGRQSYEPEWYADV